MLVLLFAGTLSWLPPSGYVRFTEDPVDNLRYMVLPVVALAFGEAAYIARTTRSAIEDALGQAVSSQFLRAKGVTERNLVFRHALRNAARADRHGHRHPVRRPARRRDRRSSTLFGCPGSAG